jgi:murein DD-endopeptidase MepM/ murein hydrolase activator NlpD
MKPVPSCAAGSDAVAGQTRQALTESHRSKARTSAAVLGLAISMGASNLLVPQQGEAAVSKHLPATDMANGMPASPKADPKSDRGSADTSPLRYESEMSQTEAPLSSVDRLRQRFNNDVSEIDEPNQIELKVTEIGSNARPEDPPALTQDLSSMEAAIATDADMGKPEPSFLVEPVSSKQPEFMFSGSSTTAASLEVSLPSVNYLSNDELGMTPTEGTLTAPGEQLHRTITPGSGIYTADRSDSIADQEMLMAPSPLLSASQQNPVEVEAGTTGAEWKVPQINIEYSNPIPVPELLSESEATDPVETAREIAVEKAELEPLSWSQEEVAREISSEAEAQLPIAIEPVEFQFAPTSRPLESNPESEVVVSPDLTNAVVIESSGATAAASRIYQVGVGETLDAIAEKNNVSVSDLMAANQIGDPNFIKAKEQIKIPLIDKENFTSRNASTSEDFPSDEVSTDYSVDGSSSPVVLGTDAIYPLAPTRRMKAKSESIKSIALPSDDRQNMGTVTSDAQTKTPYVNSLKADLEKLREQYPMATPEAQYQSEPELPIEMGSSWQPSQTVMVTVPDLPVADSQPSRAAIEIAQGIQDVASENPAEVPQPPTNGYVQDLMSDIERLRQNREDQEAAKVQWEANEPDASGEGYFRTIAPELSSEESDRVLQAAIDDKPDEKRQRPATLSPENAKDPREQEQTSRDLLATGSSGTAAYQPLLQPTTGQMVSPQLPPLNGPETYLPDSRAIFNGYIWPANGILSSGYGWRWGRMHNGIDIAGPVGTPIFAAASGVVTYAGWNDGGYGNLVEIEHPDGSFTVYAHNHRIVVREGQEVGQGEQVAEMGSTGFSTGPHLHFEIHPSGDGAVNPIAYLPGE